MTGQPLPSGWASTTLGELCKPKYGKALPKDLRDEGARVPVVGSAGVMTGTHTPLVPGPCLVIGRKGNIGQVQLFDSPCWPIDTTFYIQPPTFVDRKFLKHALSAVDFGALNRSTTTPSLRREELESVPILLPPLPEQHRIVGALEDHISRLDAAELSLVSAARRAELLISRLVDHTVLGVATSAPVSGEPASDLKGKHNRFDYQGLPSLPQGWSWKLAADLCKSINSGSTPKSEFMQQDHGEIPFLKVYNIDPVGRVDFTKNPTFVSRDTHYGQLKRSIALPGDVVTNIVGPPLGKSAVVPDSYPEWNTNQAIVSFRAGDSIHPSWLALCLRSPFIIRLLKSTAKATAGQFNIALSTCRELSLPVPPLRTQEVLLEELDAAILALEHANIAQRTSRSRSTTLRSALLRSAFNGRLVDQDPTDEPAGVALERTRNHQPAAPPRRRRKAAAK